MQRQQLTASQQKGSAQPQKGAAQRQLVIVSGAPGAGKTTLAVPLAAQLGFPLFCKDFIKETLTDVLGNAGGDLAASRRLGAAAMELMWTLARNAPCAVLEANFRPYSDYERCQLLSLAATVVEVHCECGREETLRRFSQRAASGQQHGAHPLAELTDAMLAEYDRPVALGKVIRVDTRLPLALQPLVDEVRAELI